MTPPAPRTGFGLVAAAGLATVALGLLAAHTVTASAAVRAVVPVHPIAPSTIPLSADLSPSDSRTIPIHVPAPATATRTLRAVSTVYVAAPTRTVTATRTSTATVTAVQTATVTATATVTQTITATPLAPTTGSAP